MGQRHRPRRGVPERILTATDDELAQLRTALRGMLDSHDDGTLPSPDPEWRVRWPDLAAMGLSGFCAAEDRGGFGLRADAAAAAANELGAALHGAPFAALTAAVHALAACADPEIDGLVADLLTGERLCSFGRLDDDRATARLVDGGAGVDAVVVEDPQGGLLLVSDPAAWSAAPVPHEFDVTRPVVDLVLDPAKGRPIPMPPAVRTLRGLLLAADTVGGVRRVLDRTVDYAGQRQAFGRPIGGFQAVQHRLADHAVRVRGMGLLVDRAARTIRNDEPAAARAVTLAELSVHSGATHILHDLLQLTGAIGFTWEYGLHHYQRRSHQNARLAGGTRSAVSALTATEGWGHAG